ncbi:hypothetical protein DFH09DRAFT_1189930 [Mycena vulgaris]|nr:hypothetical protein DFH09DRAFT_1189930 [Mycena vulgaris]
MPIINNSTGFQIHGGSFYEVSGDVIMNVQQTQQQLMIEAQAQPSARLQPLAGPVRTPRGVESQDGETERGRSGPSGAVRSQRRIVAPAPPYDASSRPRMSSRSSANFDEPAGSSAVIPFSAPPTLTILGEFIPDWIRTTVSASPSSGLSTLDPLAASMMSTPDPFINPWLPWSNPEYPLNHQYTHARGDQENPWIVPQPNYPNYSSLDFAPSYITNSGALHSVPYLGSTDAHPVPSIHSGTFISAQNVNHNFSRGETGINILHRVVALETLHDSADSFPQPRCHPETREEMLNDLWDYATSSEAPDQILWLYGPAGAGKSAIMWSLCERLHRAGRLGGTFFFKRGHPTRGNAKALFCTIAYRLALRIPALKGLILQVVENDPSLVAATPEIQLQRLILEPCQSLTNHDPPIIIIDGLDECEGHQMQQEILRIFRNSFPQYQPCVRILISSRPEAHIGDLAWGAYCAVNVEQSFTDVRIYLADEFARIHHDYPRTMPNIPRPWPSEEELETLVTQSSGHFIYASTIIKFIDDANFRPTERLAAVLENSAEPDLDSPFGALDQLYTQILNSVPRHRQLLSILRVIFYFPGILSPHQIDQLLDLIPGDTSLTLRGLHSIIQYRNKNQDPDRWVDIRWEHASFGDFLSNPTRSGKFYVGGLAPCMNLARQVLKALSHQNGDENTNRVHWYEPHSHAVWRIRWRWIELLVSAIPPTAELLPLIRLINPVFLFCGPNNVAERNKIIGWFTQIQPVPVDLIQLWEDYIFMDHFGDSCYSGHPSNPGLSTWDCEELLSQTPGLLNMFSNHLIPRGEFKEKLLLSFHVFLNLSWDKIRSIICPLRDLVGQDREKVRFLYRFMRDKAQQHHSLVEHKDVAYRCIRVLKAVDSGELHVNFWSMVAPSWGLLIRLHSPCPDLLQKIREFVPSSWLLLECQLRLIDIHNVVQWLKTFPEPPLEVIHRWEGYFMKVYQNTTIFPWFKQEIEDQNTKYSFDDSFDCVPHLMSISDVM